MLKAKLIIIAFALFSVCLSQAYFQGRIDFDKEESDTAFADYVNFNRQFQKEKKKIMREEQQASHRHGHIRQKPVNTASSPSAFDALNE